MINLKADYVTNDLREVRINDPKIDWIYTVKFNIRIYFAILRSLLHNSNIFKNYQGSQYIQKNQRDIFVHILTQPLFARYLDNSDYEKFNGNYPDIEKVDHLIQRET